MGMRTSVVALLALALASIAWEPPVRAEVVVVAGRADGRRGAALDAAGISEPFATAFDAEGRLRDASAAARFVAELAVKSG